MDMPEMEAARLRMEDRVRGLRRPAPHPRHQTRLAHQLRRAARQLRRDPDAGA